MAALENVSEKDFVRRFLIEQKHTYEELANEIKARHSNLKGCSLRSVKRFYNHQGIRKRMPVSEGALKCRSRHEHSSRLPVGKIFFYFLPRIDPDHSFERKLLSTDRKLQLTLGPI